MRFSSLKRRLPNLKCRLKTCRPASRACSTSARSSSAIWPTRERSSPWAAARRPRGGDNGVRSVGDIKLLARAVTGIDIKDLKSLADEGKKQIGSGVVAFVATSEDGKASIVVGVTPDLTARFKAVDLVRKGVRGAGRQGRRRPARHGAGRRSGRRQGRRRAGGDRGRARRVSRLACRAA